MQLPTISQDQIKSKTDFLKFILNTKRTSKDWESLGAFVASFLYELLDDESKNPKDDEELKDVFQRLTNPIAATTGIAACLESDENIAWEFLLMQSIIATESPYVTSVSESFGVGLMNFYILKFPRLAHI